jgi:hypothetical protein
MKFFDLSKIPLIPCLMIFFTFVIISGCSSKSAMYSDSYRPEAVMAERAREKRAYKQRQRRSSPKPVMKRESKRVDDVSQVESPKTARMIHYNGFLKLRVSKPNDAINKATEIIKYYGGYVEYLREMSVSFRVPVKKFKKAYGKLKTLGDVLRKTISAEDITDAYSNMDLRLRVAQETRDRFLELLKRTKREREKIRLIKEIQRLNEKIERFRDRLKLLSSLASYSRISLHLVPRTNLVKRSNKTDKAGFRWIYNLSPFSKSVANSGIAVDLKVPDGMVKLASNRYWIAESPNGVTLLSYRRRNSPKGTTRFWVAAVKKRIKGEFSSVKVSEIKHYKVLRLTSLSEKPYIYVIGFRAIGDQTYMFEIYFPDQKLEKRYSKSIMESINNFKIEPEK